MTRDSQKYKAAYKWVTSHINDTPYNWVTSHIYDAAYKRVTSHIYDAPYKCITSHIYDEPYNWRVINMARRLLALYSHGAVYSDMTHSHVWHDSSIYVTWLIHTADIHWWHVTCKHMFTVALKEVDVSCHIYGWVTSLKRWVTWLLPICHALYI